MSIDVNLAIDKLIGASGDIALGVSRYNQAKYKSDGNGEDKFTTEYDILEAITSDEEASTKLVKRYRILSIIKTFDLLQALAGDLMSNIDKMKPSEIARTHSTLLSTFNSLTTPATKVMFDFESELKQMAEEFHLPVETIEADVKAMMAKK